MHEQCTCSAASIPALRAVHALMVMILILFMHTLRSFTQRILRNSPISSSTMRSHNISFREEQLTPFQSPTGSSASLSSLSDEEAGSDNLPIANDITDTAGHPTQALPVGSSSTTFVIAAGQPGGHVIATGTPPLLRSSSLSPNAALPEGCPLEGTTRGHHDGWGTEPSDGEQVSTNRELSSQVPDRKVVLPSGPPLSRILASSSLYLSQQESLAQRAPSLRKATAKPECSARLSGVGASCSRALIDCCSGGRKGAVRFLILCCTFIISTGQPIRFECIATT